MARTDKEKDWTPDLLHFEAPSHLPGGFLVMTQPFRPGHILNFQIREDEFSSGEQSVNLGVTSIPPRELSECDLPESMEGGEEEEEPLIQLNYYWNFLSPALLRQSLPDGPLKAHDLIRIHRKDRETIRIRVWRCGGGMKRRGAEILFRAKNCPSESYFILYAPTDPWLFHPMSKGETMQYLQLLPDAPPLPEAQTTGGASTSTSPTETITTSRRDGASNQNRWAQSAPSTSTRGTRKKFINLAASKEKPTPANISKESDRTCKINEAEKEVDPCGGGSEGKRGHFISICCRSECRICMRMEVLNMVLDCGHWGLCQVCIEKILNQPKRADRTCPICRQVISKPLTIYIS